MRKPLWIGWDLAPPLCVSSPGSSIPTWPWWLSDSAPLKNFDTKSDFWELRPIRHLISMMSRQKDKKRQKHKKATGKNTKIQKKWKIRKDKKATRRRDNMKKIQKIQLDQKDSLVLWRQGSFKLLRCFFLQWNPFGIGDPPPPHFCKQKDPNKSQLLMIRKFPIVQDHPLPKKCLCLLNTAMA